MWTLLIISTVIGLDEPKVTRYAEYATAIDCVEDAIELYKEFNGREKAICEYVEYD